MTPATSSPRDPHALHGTEPHSQENGGELLFQLVEGNVGAHVGAVELDPHRPNHLDLAQAVRWPQLVFRNAVRGQPPGKRPVVEDRDGEPALAQLGGAGQRRRTAADTGDLLGMREWRRSNPRGATRLDAPVEILHGKALESADLDRLLVVTVHDTGAFAEDIDRAGPRAAHAQDVRLEDHPCRTLHVAAGDALDETGNVDVCRAGGHARRVEAVEAPICLGHRRTGVQRRMQVREELEVLRQRQPRFAHAHPLHLYYTLRPDDRKVICRGRRRPVSPDATFRPER